MYTNDNRGVVIPAGYVDASGSNYDWWPILLIHGHYLPQNDQLVAESSMRVHPDTFPGGTTFYWDVTPDPDWGGINGYLHVAWGNYDNSPRSITPRQVSAITDLRLNVGWSFTGDTSTGLLCECWLSPAAAASGPFTPWWAQALLLVGWLVATVRAVRWWSSHPVRVVWVPVVCVVVWFDVLWVGAAHLGW